eukprot:916424-Pleurochrysis_carterae.AAC.1
MGPTVGYDGTSTTEPAHAPSQEEDTVVHVVEPKQFKLGTRVRCRLRPDEGVSTGVIFAEMS